VAFERPFRASRNPDIILLSLENNLIATGKMPVLLVFLSFVVQSTTEQFAGIQSWTPASAGVTRKSACARSKRVRFRLAH